MIGQMCWLAESATEEKILHLRLQPQDSWQPYTVFSGYKVPDYTIPEGSRGWATFQHLLRAGWTILPSDQTSDQTSDVPALAAITAKYVTKQQCA